MGGSYRKHNAILASLALSAREAGTFHSLWLDLCVVFSSFADKKQYIYAKSTSTSTTKHGIMYLHPKSPID